MSATEARRVVGREGERRDGDVVLHARFDHGVGSTGWVKPAGWVPAVR
jgi:hypothetical protein